MKKIHKYIIVSILLEVLLYLTIWYLGQNFFFNSRERFFFILLSFSFQFLIWFIYIQDEVIK